MRIFTLPVRWLFRLLLHTGLGLLGLFVVNLLGEPFGIALGLNLINGAVVGTLGLPGLSLLLLLRWLFA